MGPGYNIHTISTKETRGPVCTELKLVYLVLDRKESDEGDFHGGFMPEGERGLFLVDESLIHRTDGRVL